MKTFLNSVFFVIVVFNGRNLKDAFASEKSSGERDLYKSLEDMKNGQESVLTLPNKLEINTNILEETEKQELLLPSQSAVGDPPYLDKIELSPELSTTAETIVFPSADTAVELQNRVRTPFHHDKLNSSNQLFNSFQEENEEYVVHAEPKIQVQAIPEETVKKELNKSESVSKSSHEETKKTAPQHEDIPSFSEWTQKQLAEAEKKKTDQNETTDKFSKTRGKFRNKNYASPDCGAKIVAANPESLSSSSVLSPLKDEYMLNYCANRIWFVVELCEAIQAKQLDLANFELFSSSPKLFSVFVSHRFPTRDWSGVGKFTAQDSRDVQTFNLNPHLFGKYLKVELHSHYGREQFCPISWVGIYGTSEYEVLAKEDERHLLQEEEDPYDEDLFVGHRRDSPKNLFSSATDAVLSIVKKATAPFMKTNNNETESEDSEKSPEMTRALCVSPRYITVCNNCSQSFYDEVFHILSCQHWILERLISNTYVKLTLINSDSCTKFGLDFNGLRRGAPFPSNYFENPKQENNYLTLMLKNSVIAALCNVLAVSENKVVVNNTAEDDQTLKNVTLLKESCDVSPSNSDVTASASSSCEGDCSRSATSQFHHTKSSTFTDIFKAGEKFSKKIEPTKTLTEDEVKMLPPSEIYLEDTVKISEEKSTKLPVSGDVTSTATMKLGKERSESESFTQKEPKVSFVESKVETEKETEGEDQAFNGTNHDSTLESIISDINAIEKAGSSHSSSVPPSTSNLPAESIFLRLANRIKNLEINMSLSSTYLEELSKRYRVQLELLSKTLNLTIQKIEEQSRTDEEKERKREKEISLLRTQLANLTRDVSILIREKNSWKPRASSISQHLFFISVEILLVWTVFSYWKRSVEHKSSTERSEVAKKIFKKYKRRNSLEGVKGHETPKRKTRRPSDEALEIALSRRHPEDLLKMDKKRKRRKKDSKCSINVLQLKRKKSEAAAPDVAVEKEIASVVSEEIQAPEFIPNNLLSAREIEIKNRFSIISSPKTERSNSVSRTLQGLSSSPIFMKTALAARNSRFRSALDKDSSQGQSESVKTDEETAKKEVQKERKGSSSLKKYMKKFF